MVDETLAQKREKLSKKQDSLGGLQRLLIATCETQQELAGVKECFGEPWFRPEWERCVLVCMKYNYRASRSCRTCFVLTWSGGEWGYMSPYSIRIVCMNISIPLLTIMLLFYLALNAGRLQRRCCYASHRGHSWWGRAAHAHTTMPCRWRIPTVPFCTISFWRVPLVTILRYSCARKCLSCQLLTKKCICS